ncbi:hypothetical protein N7462_009593 [Penicillium macrosclerotiorum]|uniref:uncharacterized protein n=1 Tax=Penicillium macrosclerotiorum TaxID=303699 RepID=UPI002546DD2E|nr:uncharacterized protein N7462_009593 [Penicillium macrosclerotiorum]KAJ5674154.1 hypothetical protein N7462_009593 [Penicillium macrosclerotiorum]
MALEYAHYQPATPPGASFQMQTGSVQSRNASISPIFTNDSSPWSTMTGNTSPTTSPARYHHGPALLPKIRPQDVVIEPTSTSGPMQQRRVLSNTRNPPGFVPYTSRPPVQRRNGMNPARRLALAIPNSSTVSPGPQSVSAIPTSHSTLSPIVLTGSGSVSAISSPVAIIPQKRRGARGHSRSVSTSNIDEATLSRYGYPTYRQLPNFMPYMQPQTVPNTPCTPVTPATPNVVVHPSYPQQQPQTPDVLQSAPMSALPSPHPLVVPNIQYNYDQSAVTHQISDGSLSPVEDSSPPSTNLITYLTSPTQAINLVRNVSVVPTRGMHDYFWWDIRNLRCWTTFSMSTFDSIRGLTQLLKTEIAASLAPPVAVNPGRLAPESEPALVNLIRDLYAPRVNAALAVSQGAEHLQLYAAPDMRNTGHKNHGHPHFLANYATDRERTGSGLPRGRLVGIVKSFDRWNSGMRNEGPHRRVEYLNGLAHLQRCMREHSCRYGFIITEIELVCVRAGCDPGDDVPYFGFLEVAAPIPLKTAGGETHDPVPPATPISNRSFSSSSHNSLSHSLPDISDTADDVMDQGFAPMTASLALYFLLMLSKSVPLPSQPSAHLNVGGPGALTRQRVLPEPKDKWIPEPQIGEKRDAKRVRGWIMPHDAWHRREGGGAPRRSAEGVKMTKKWHK